MILQGRAGNPDISYSERLKAGLELMQVPVEEIGRVFRRCHDLHLYPPIHPGRALEASQTVGIDSEVQNICIAVPFDALAEPTRRQIVEMLAREGAMTAGDIQARFEVSAPAISQHLKVLREAGLVQVEKRAQQRIYRINPESMLELEAWAKRVRELWTGRFDALDALLRVEQSKSPKE